ncbi:hypothetical protein ABIF65_004317 [Bradyrhizobium japonicum]|jgi:hypothetical protein|uniref:Transcriptional regulator n=1 Tax=Bradyrhizobium japonicum TaxID=375 RepID=A0ABV2RR05_BRAJP|nr:MULTISPECIES: hypothetical protein [Bradyrhizobium]MBR0883784.1 hypothetical protein [Bradyrhizobium liaoningense]MBR0946109.1 hypothetical protein [Bradyrhizobium liaoningense]MBR1003568.1 hypothetical protein [Bradyrhizobium liaoningense]MBR1034370.1 hypothetical protein [Bradyrhizobium liaoningense]MBR1066200.1 hypothetical protein [Bradyrhizobium liaoningense]
MRQSPSPNTKALKSQITRGRLVSGALSGKCAPTPQEFRELRIKELRAAAAQLVRRAEVLRAEAERLIKIAEREKAKLARKRRGPTQSAAAPSAKALRHPG